ncbi:mitochondrial assembly of ribosomal large subunit protein 1 [Toxotes jaculatrix]|uniref:mitochondrial assembly of ribosomal large subunit protein 1 n=1 Tax=Toxotes jaculatrix TaxID=941984 RepID=UPI001B3ABB2B|nr:mitochondrial assembly of ribosomal large subunit protein 1 [Toxotes jaculatrix]
MSILNRCNKLVSSAFKRSVFAEQTGVFRRVCPIPKARCHSFCLTRQFTPNLASCQRRRFQQVFTCHLDTKRCYSEMYSGSTNSDKGTDMSSEDSHEMDSDSRAPSLRPSETFSLDVLVSLLRQENAVDICVIEVPDQIKYAEYFIVVSGVSPRHLRAMALYAIKVYKFLKKDGDPNVKIEGKDAEDWMCIDFGNMVVHFMMPETRDIYELEKLWTLRKYDEQLRSMPAEILPEDFVYDADVTK